MENILGSYPVIINSEDVGSIEIHKEGPMTVFEASCRDTGALVRLSVFGESEGYLGVMMPREGRLHLRKKLSSASMSGFPKKITHAGPRGGGSGPDEAAVPTRFEPGPAFEAMGHAEPVSEPVQAVSESPAHEKNAGSAGVNEEAENEDADGDIIWTPEPNPWSLFSDHVDKFPWRTCRGAVTRRTGEGYLLAVPEFSPQRFPEVPVSRVKEVRSIEGRDYAVFIVINGKLA